MNLYLYPHSKLTQAVEILVTEMGSDRNKLLKVAQTLHVLSERDFPEHLKTDWIFYKENISNKSAPKGYDPENKQGNFYWTTQQMHWKTIKKIKQAVWNLYEGILEEVENTHDQN